MTLTSRRLRLDLVRRSKSKETVSHARRSRDGRPFHLAYIVYPSDVWNDPKEAEEAKKNKFSEGKS